MSAQHVVVTGASGFVGRHVLAALAGSGLRITALSRHPPDWMPAGVAFHGCDLLDPRATSAAMRELAPSHLIHSAWDVTPGVFWGAPANLDWVAASFVLYRAFADGGGRRAVFVGTCAEYDWSFSHLAESGTPLAPATFYGIAKHALHSVLAPLARQQGISLAWARLFLLYGPYEAPGRLVSGIARDILEGRRVALTEGTQVRDFMHVADVGRALAALLRSDVTGPVNIASGAPVQVRHVAEKIATLAGRPDLLDIGARPMPVQEPLFLTADVTRLREEVGFAPQFDLDTGLADTFAWWRARLGWERGRLDPRVKPGDDVGGE